MSECNHCWHHDGNTLTSNPPQYRHICCRCDESRNERQILPVIGGEHGEFVKQLPMFERAKTKEASPQPTIEQVGQELNDWLVSRGVTLQVIAIGLRTGQPCAIEDFMPVTHKAEITIVKATQK